MRSARLRVGVDAALTRLRPVTGHGRVWHAVLAELSALVDLVVLDTGHRRLWPGTGGSRQVDVQLADGHAFPPSTRAPLVVQVHEAGWDEPATRDTVDPRFARHIREATAAAVSAATAVITPSQSARSQVLDRYRLVPGSVRVVQHGVDSTVFTPDAGSAGRRAVAAALGTERPYVLFASSVHPRKNLPLLRASMSQLVSEGRPHALALLVSPAPDRADSDALLAAATAELPAAPGRVARLSAPDDRSVAALMAGCEVFCLPSASEGFGLTVLEAMSCSAAVVAADRGALPEVVAGTGVLVAPEAPALTTAIRGLIDEPDRRHRLGGAARARATDLSWSRTAAGWYDVLLAAVDGAIGTAP